MYSVSNLLYDKEETRYGGIHFLPWCDSDHENEPSKIDFSVCVSMCVCVPWVKFGVARERRLGAKDENDNFSLHWA